MSGLTQTEAYRQAYNASKMKDATITNNAYMLMQNKDIKARYESLMNKHAEKALYTRQEAVRDLLWIKEKARESIEKTGLKQANGGHYLNSVKELCLLEDHYPTKNKKEDDKAEKQVAKVLKEALEDI